jgi:hypothetical protein
MNGKTVRGSSVAGTPGRHLLAALDAASCSGRSTCREDERKSACSQRFSTASTSPVS